MAVRSALPPIARIRLRRLPAAILSVTLAATVYAANGAAQQSPPGAPLVPLGTPELRAQLTPRDFTTLSSEMAGRIDKIATRIGEHFHKGDLLVVFDCAVPRAQMAKARAVVTQADKTYTINQRLVALKSMGQLELDVSAAEVQKAKADLAVAEATASKCEIAAPFNGVTVEQKAREFEYTTAGQPLLDILDDHALDVELIAPSRWLEWLKPGYPFQVNIGETGKTYSAKILRIGGRVDPISQSIKVIGEINGDAPELKAGMSGRASILPPQQVAH
jgi:membrane fusion protein, multidrug efflux system